MVRVRAKDTLIAIMDAMLLIYIQIMSGCFTLQLTEKLIKLSDCQCYRETKFLLYVRIILKVTNGH